VAWMHRLIRGACFMFFPRAVSFTLLFVDGASSTFLTFFPQHRSVAGGRVPPSGILLDARLEMGFCFFAPMALADKFRRGRPFFRRSGA